MAAKTPFWLKNTLNVRFRTIGLQTPLMRQNPIKKCNNSDCFYAINKFFLMFILALKLAKTLGITVEELFFLESSEK
ncbi:hypothetical protein XBKB1_1830004 [Xenorhabdus bovienii str. kraussei Becker Underwood]|uniref:Uncharacterized protein n=1 Tax=Xenorhabdus bovienii str. kraussei Becker Underwood TaxID=1398204 RepID=A0A077PR74_XENBV|nr:hypothetical protein XBKB1_1830004 [Xenorhabdus bovienii str. kraussei Becker Underwood]